MERSSAPECPPCMPSQAHNLDPTQFRLERPAAVAADTTEVVSGLLDWQVDAVGAQGSSSDGFSTWDVQPADTISDAATVPQGWWKEHCIADVLLVLDGEQLPGEGYERVAMLGAPELGEHAILSAIVSSDEFDTEASTHGTPGSDDETHGDAGADNTEFEVDDSSVSLMLSLLDDSGVSEAAVRTALRSAAGDVEAAMSLVFECMEEPNVNEAGATTVTTDAVTQEVEEQDGDGEKVDAPEDKAQSSEPAPRPCAIYIRRVGSSSNRRALTSICFCTNNASDVQLPLFQRITHSAGGCELEIQLSTMDGNQTAQTGHLCVCYTKLDDVSDTPPLLSLCMATTDAHLEGTGLTDLSSKCGNSEVSVAIAGSCFDLANKVVDHNIDTVNGADDGADKAAVMLCCAGHRWGEHPLESTHRVARSGLNASASTVSFAVIDVLPNAEMVTGTAQIQSPSPDSLLASQSVVGIVSIKEHQPRLMATCWPHSTARNVAQAAPSSVWATFNGANANTDTITMTMWGAWFNTHCDCPVAGACGAPDDTLRLMVCTMLLDTYHFMSVTS